MVKLLSLVLSLSFLLPLALTQGPPGPNGQPGGNGPPGSNAPPGPNGQNNPNGPTNGPPAANGPPPPELIQFFQTLQGLGLNMLSNYLMQLTISSSPAAKALFDALSTSGTGSGGPYTLFAPNDAAFMGLMPNVTSNPDAMANLLAYHVVHGSFPLGPGNVPQMPAFAGTLPGGGPLPPPPSLPPIGQVPGGPPPLNGQVPPVQAVPGQASPPPGSVPPGQVAPGQIPPGGGPPGQVPPGQGPPPGQAPPGSMPQGQMPPGQGPLPGSPPPGGMTPGQMPPPGGPGSPATGGLPPGAAPVDPNLAGGLSNIPVSNTPIFFPNWDPTIGFGVVLGRTLLNDPRYVQLEGKKAQVLGWSNVPGPDGLVRIINQNVDVPILATATSNSLTINVIPAVLSIPGPLDAVLLANALAGFGTMMKQIPIPGMVTDLLDMLHRTDLIHGYTLFAPDDGAVARAQPLLTQVVGANGPGIGTVLQNHIVNGSTLYSPTFSSPSFSYGVIAASGEPLVFTTNTSGTFVTVNLNNRGPQYSARIMRTELLTNNGIVHVVDGMLLSTWQDGNAANAAYQAATSMAAMQTATETGAVGLPTGGVAGGIVMSSARSLRSRLSSCHPLGSSNAVIVLSIALGISLSTVLS